MSAGVHTSAWRSLALPVECTVGQFVAFCSVTKLWDAAQRDGKENCGQDSLTWHGDCQETTEWLSDTSHGLGSVGTLAQFRLDTGCGHLVL